MKSLNRAQVEALGSQGASKSGQIARCLNDYLLVVNGEDKSITPCLIRDGYWESWVTSWFTHNLLPGHTFIDIGANCGYYTFLAEVLVGEAGKVYAFEPNPDYVKLLKASVKLNDSKNIFVMPYALGEDFSIVNLHIPGDFHGSAAVGIDFSSRYTEKIYQVAQHPLDAYNEFLPSNETLIKIDAEGYEESVLDGAIGFLNSRDEVTIVLEYTPGAYSNAFFEKMMDVGHVTLLNYEGRESGAVKKFIERQPDWVTLVIRKR